MDSDMRDGCSHPPGFPIRISPDHSLLAAPRSFSQLTTSFFAYLRLGIHTHALSSLTIKSTSHTGTLLSRAYTCVLHMPVKYSVVKDLDCRFGNPQTSFLFAGGRLVGLGRIELPTSPLSGVRSSQLSYRPMSAYWWSWSGSNRRPPECKSGALPAELQPLVTENQSRPVGYRDHGTCP